MLVSLLLLFPLKVDTSSRVLIFKQCKLCTSKATLEGRGKGDQISHSLLLSITIDVSSSAFAFRTVVLLRFRVRPQVVHRPKSNGADTASTPTRWTFARSHGQRTEGVLQRNGTKRG